MLERSKEAKMEDQMTDKMERERKKDGGKIFLTFWDMQEEEIGWDRQIWSKEEIQVSYFFEMSYVFHGLNTFAVYAYPDDDPRVPVLSALTWPNVNPSTNTTT